MRIMVGLQPQEAKIGLSKKKVTTKESQTVAPSAYAEPYVTDAAQTFKPAYEQGMAIQQQFQPGLMGAFNYYNDTLNGKNLDGNPYLDDIVADSNADITEAVNQQFMPRFGSGYHAKALAKQLGANERQLRYGDYAQERAYQDAAGGRMAGLATTATTLPSIPSSTYAQNVGGLLGRYVNGTGTSTTTQSGGLGSILGPLLQVGSMFLPVPKAGG